jgi:hypothetical protein
MVTILHLKGSLDYCLNNAAMEKTTKYFKCITRTTLLVCADVNFLEICKSSLLLIHWSSADCFVHKKCISTIDADNGDIGSWVDASSTQHEISANRRSNIWTLKTARTIGMPQAHNRMPQAERRPCHPDPIRYDSGKPVIAKPHEW